MIENSLIKELQEINANKNVGGVSEASVVSYAATSSESEAMCARPRRFFEMKFPHFYGDAENVHEWVYKCERIFEFDKTPESMKVNLASIHLEGTAIPWHQVYIKERISSGPVDWCKYSKALVKRFSELDPWSELKKLKQIGSIQEYRERFEFLYSQVDLQQDYVVPIFISGLKPELQPAVEVFKPKNLARAYELARLQEASLAAQTETLRSYHDPHIYLQDDEHTTRIQGF